MSKTLMRRLLCVLVACACGVSLACEPYIEEHSAWNTARFRPHRDVFDSCEVDEQSYRRVIRDWLRHAKADARDLSSFALGRIVAYPWLSRYIADVALQSPQWAARMSQAGPGERHGLAAPVLQDPALLERLAVPFKASPYQVLGISYEKVLYGRADVYSSNSNAGAVMVPFDAQLWLRLAPRGEAGLPTDRTSP